jgi:hypothetical protein
MAHARLGERDDAHALLATLRERAADPVVAAGPLAAWLHDAEAASEERPKR